MAINITFDNDRSTVALDTLTLDENSGVQTPIGTDDGNDIDATLTAAVDGTIGGFTTVMNGILNAATIFGFAAFELSDAQKVYLSTVDGASSSLDFVKVTVTEGETIDDLFFSDADGNDLAGAPVVGMTTLDGLQVYLWSDGDLAIATTSNVAGEGRIVALFCLHEDADHLNAQIQMTCFEQLSHPITTDADDSLNFTDVLNVSASGSITFDFDQLQSGSSLWVAVGSSTAGLLVTGGDPEVDGANKKTNDSDVIHTSQGGEGATIGLNNQLFDNAGETAVFTLVTGFSNLVGEDDGATGDYTVDPKPNDNKPEGINYSGYINTTGAGIFISQSQGSPATAKDFDINLFTAGGGTTPEDLTGYIPGLASDTPVDAETVTVVDENGDPVGTWALAPSGGQFANGSTHDGVTVTISGNNIDVNGVFGEYTVSWTTDGDTFNRFTLVSEAGQFDVGRVDVDNVVGDTEAVGGSLIVDDAGPAIGNIVNSTVPFTTGASSGAVGLLDVPRTDLEDNLEITDFTESFLILGKTIEGQINAANTEVKYFEDTNNNNILDAGETHWYTLSISQNGNGADFYDFDVVNAPAAPPLEFNFAGLPSGQNLFGMVASAGAPNGPGIVFFSNTADIKDPGNGEMDKGSGTINTSQGGGPTTIGSNNQMIDPGEGIFFTIVNDPDDRYLANVPDGLDQNEADDADFMDYASLREVPGAFMRVSQTQGNEVEACTIEAFNITNNATEQRALLTAAKTHVDITKVLVYNGSIAPANLLAETIAGADDDLTDSIGVSISGGIATVSGLEAGYLVVWETSGNHDQVLVTGTDGKFDIGGFGLSEPQVTPDHSLTFEVTLTDGDGDTAVDDFTINVDSLLFP